MLKIINKIGQYRIRDWFQRNQAAIKVITVHHSAISQDSDNTDEGFLQRLQDIHQARGWPGISYHFVIQPNGNVYQLNNFTDITWHDSINNDSIGILVHGYMHSPKNDKPTPQQLGSLKELLDWLCTQNPQFPADHDDVLGHRDRIPTACPGDNLYSYTKEYRENHGDVNWNVSGDDIQLDELKRQLEEYKERNRVLEIENTNYQTELAYLNRANKGLSDKIVVLENEIQQLKREDKEFSLSDFTIKELLQEILLRLPT